MSTNQWFALIGLGLAPGIGLVIIIILGIQYLRGKWY